MISTGFTQKARFPDFPITVMGIGHPSSPQLLDWRITPDNNLARANRQLLEQAAEQAGYSLREFAVDQTFHEFEARFGPPLVTNHADNAQGYRLYERKARSVVTGPESFPNAVIDWDSFRRHERAFRKSRVVQIRYLIDRWTRPARYQGRRMRRRIGRLVRGRR